MQWTTNFQNSRMDTCRFSFSISSFHPHICAAKIMQQSRRYTNDWKIKKFGGFNIFYLKKITWTNINWEQKKITWVLRVGEFHCKSNVRASTSTLHCYRIANHWRAFSTVPYRRWLILHLFDLFILNFLPSLLWDWMSLISRISLSYNQSI